MRRGLVSAAWLATKIQSQDVKVLDASWYLPQMNRDPKAEFNSNRIQGAKFFDLDENSDQFSVYPHMMIPVPVFGKRMAELGISKRDFVVAYDGLGIFSAPRLWWMFQVCGHDRCAVLDGGFPGFIKNYSHLVDSGPDVTYVPEVPQEEWISGPYRADLVRNLDYMIENMNSPKEQVVDARAPGRFNGTEPEPRPGIRSGHIPGSLHVFFKDVLTEDGHMKDSVAIKQRFREAGIELDDESKGGIVATCGSGVTACIDFLAMTAAGTNRHLSLYDGSWSEWAAQPELPREPSNGVLREAFAQVQ